MAGSWCAVSHSKTPGCLKLTSKSVTDQALQLKAGVMIGNSEIGFAQVTVEPFLYRLPCTNDVILTEGTGFRHRHANSSAEKFSERIAQGILHAVRLVETAVFTLTWPTSIPCQTPVARSSSSAESGSSIPAYVVLY